MLILNQVNMGDGTQEKQQTNNKLSKTKLKITARKRSSISFCWFVVDS